MLQTCVCVCVFGVAPGGCTYPEAEATLKTSLLGVTSAKPGADSQLMSADQVCEWGGWESMGGVQGWVCAGVCTPGTLLEEGPHPHSVYLPTPLSPPTCVTPCDVQHAVVCDTLSRSVRPVVDPLQPAEGFWRGRGKGATATEQRRWGWGR